MFDKREDDYPEVEFSQELEVMGMMLIAGVSLLAVVAMLL